MLLPDIEFTEYFDDHNESEHNIGQLEVVEAIFFGEKIHRKILYRTADLYITVFVDPSREPWRILSAIPSKGTDRRYFNEHSINDPNIEED